MKDNIFIVFYFFLLILFLRKITAKILNLVFYKIIDSIGDGDSLQELLVSESNCKNGMFAETHGDMRLRASLLRKQVWHESAKATPRPTQAGGMRQETSRLSLL